MRVVVVYLGERCVRVLCIGIGRVTTGILECLSICLTFARFSATVSSHVAASSRCFVTPTDGETSA